MITIKEHIPIPQESNFLKRHYQYTESIPVILPNKWLKCGFFEVLDLFLLKAVISFKDLTTTSTFGPNKRNKWHFFSILLQSTGTSLRNSSKFRPSTAQQISFRRKFVSQIEFAKTKNNKFQISFSLNQLLAAERASY